MENVTDRIRKTVHQWWIVVVLGILFLFLGFWVLQSPMESFVAFSIYFAIMYLISGVGAIAFSISNREVLSGWGWQLAGGCLELILGIALLANPGISMVVLAFFVGFWLLFRATSAIAVSMELKNDDQKNWGWVLVLGILTLVLAFMVLLNPLYAVSTLSIFVGLSLIMAGVVQIFIGFTMRKFSKGVDKLVE